MMRKFKNETGYTIHNYITSKRLLMARSLISQGMPVMKAAQASGFMIIQHLSGHIRNSLGKHHPTNKINFCLTFSFHLFTIISIRGSSYHLHAG